LLYNLIPFVGVAVMLAIAWAFSSNRQAALRAWPIVLWGLGLQFVFALIILRTPVGEAFFRVMNDAFMAVISATLAGSTFVFGDLGDPGRGMGFFFAFYVLPTIVFFSSLTAVLYHLGILQQLVKGIALIMQWTMKTSGAETLSASANIFVGQTEAPLMVRPFVPNMTKSEINAVMVGGFATVAGGVLAAYVGMLSGQIPNIAGHLMAASVMSAPAALMFAKIMIPETETPQTLSVTNVKVEKQYDNTIDAAAGGATEGVKLALNVGGMLIAFLALIALADLILGGIGGGYYFFTEGTWRFNDAFTLRGILGAVFAPLAFLMGVPWEDARLAGSLMGIKTVANEFVAYSDFAENGSLFQNERSRLIMAYALSGFANFGSIGIQIGGLAIMAPERRADLAKLGIPALVAGTFAANTTACIAGMLYVEGQAAAIQVIEEQSEMEGAEAFELPELDVMDAEPAPPVEIED